MEQTFWNFEFTPCRQVRVKVGSPPAPTWWCAQYEGTIRKAVEVTYHGMKFYLDDEDLSGWLKVTQGRGGPATPHRSLPDNSEVV